MLSDEEYINRIIVKYERRHKLALLYITLGILFLLAAYGAYLYLSALAYSDLFVGHLQEGMVLDAQLIDSVKSSSQASYSMGTAIGVVVSQFILPSILLIGTGVNLLLNSRKDKLIKLLYEKTKI